MHCANLAETHRIPVIPNGMGRGLLPSDHELCFSRARSMALKQADVVIVVGTPLDFRLGFGSFGDAKTIHVQDSEAGIGRHANPAAAVYGDLSEALNSDRGVRPGPRRVGRRARPTKSARDGKATRNRSSPTTTRSIRRASTGCSARSSTATRS